MLKSGVAGRCFINIEHAEDMARKDDVTSPKFAKLASGVLRGAIKPTTSQVKSLAAIVLDNAANKRAKGK